MADKILTLDIGSSRALLAEFEVRGGAAPKLLRFQEGALPVEGDDVGSPERLAVTLRQMMAEGGFKPAPLYVALPGQMVCPRFVRIPAVTKDKIGEMVAAEAEQNIPFPIEEVVWDYQAVGESDGTDIDAVLFAVKQDNVRAISEAIGTMGLEPTIIDAAPAALYNAAAYCGAGTDGCTMVLDIGFRSTGLLFVEGGKVFTRNISVAGHAITQEIQKNINCTFQEAETTKLSRGFVALGGNYAAEDERADRLSKIIRNIVTRLHAEVTRSINFYRSQQGGTAPTRLLLTGASSLLPYMDQFFADKLQIPVEFFNPFDKFGVDPGAGLDQNSANQIVRLGNCAGLALRHTSDAVLQMNLLPPTIVARKAFRRRVPFFVLSAVAMLASAFLWNRIAGHSKAGYEDQLEKIEKNVKSVNRDQSEIENLRGELGNLDEKIGMLEAMAGNRAAYPRVLEAVRRSLPNGAWLRRFHPVKFDNTGAVTVIGIEGFAFEDDLKRGNAPADKPPKFNDGAAAMDAFIKGLSSGRMASLFQAVDERTVKTSLMQTLENVREFSFELPLAHPIGVPYKILTAAAKTSGEEEEEE